MLPREPLKIPGRRPPRVIGRRGWWTCSSLPRRNGRYTFRRFEHRVSKDDGPHRASQDSNTGPDFPLRALMTLADNRNRSTAALSSSTERRLSIETIRANSKGEREGELSESRTCEQSQIKRKAIRVTLVQETGRARNWSSEADRVSACVGRGGEATWQKSNCRAPLSLRRQMTHLPVDSFPMV